MSAGTSAVPAADRAPAARGAAPGADAGLMRLEEARARMLAGIVAVPAEDVGIADALGRVLAADVASLLLLPPWDNSAMDGYAVRAADVVGARPDAPVVLLVDGEVAAGHVPDRHVERGWRDAHPDRRHPAGRAPTASSRWRTRTRCPALRSCRRASPSAGRRRPVTTSAGQAATYVPATA